MKRTYNYSNYPHLAKIEASYVEGERFSSNVLSRNEDPLLKIIFARDEFGLPSGDLTYYLSPNANPEIKKYILDNLMMDVSSAAMPKHEEIDADTAFALCRQPNETLQAYASRINEFAQVNRDVVMQHGKLDGSH